MKTGIHKGIPNVEYHADRTAVSSTWLKTINKSPFHLRAYLDSPPAEPTPALVMGSAVDCLTFEPELFEGQFIVAPKTLNRRTKAGQEEWAKLVADKRTLMTFEQYQEALATTVAITTNPVMKDIMKSGESQLTFVWRDPVTGLLCKCRPDWYDEKSGTVVDLKTAQDASPEGFSKAIANFGYHIQQAFYSDGIRICGKPVKRFIFGVMEKPDGKVIQKADPRLMAFYELDAEDVEAGQDSYTSGLSAINFCMINDEWEGYTNRVVPISRPGWARKKDVESVTAL